MLKKLIFISIVLFAPGFLIALKVVPENKKLTLITKMDYQNREIVNLREEVKENLFKTSHGKIIELTFRKYVVKKKRQFFFHYG